MADDRGPELATALIIFLITCTITVSLRCYTMGVILKRFYVEDYLAVLALMIFIAFAVLAFISLHFGLGKHNVDVPPLHRPISTKYSFLGAVIYIALSYLVKVIVGLFLVRICSASHQKWQRISIWAMLVIVGLFYAAYFFIAIFACQPVEYVWERNQPVPPADGKCNPSVAATSISYIATIMNCVADWMLAILPATVVWKAQLDRRTKISICIILGIGSIASIATLVRVAYAKELVNEVDYLYNFTPLATWSTIEVGTALTASSLATLKPLFRKFGAIFTTTNRSLSWPRTATSRRQSTFATTKGGPRLSSYSGGGAAYPHQHAHAHMPRKPSLASSGTGGAGVIEGTLLRRPPVLYPVTARWQYGSDHSSEDMEMFPGSSSPVGVRSQDSRDGLYAPSAGRTRAVEYKQWENDWMV